MVMKSVLTLFFFKASKIIWLLLILRTLTCAFSLLLRYRFKIMSAALNSVGASLHIGRKKGRPRSDAPTVSSTPSSTGRSLFISVIVLRRGKGERAKGKGEMPSKRPSPFGGAEGVSCQNH